jgi:hypothetical protein
MDGCGVDGWFARGVCQRGTGTAAEPTSAAPAESEPSAAFLEPGLRFTEDVVQAYQEALAKIDERLAEDEDALRYAGEICRDIRKGKTDAQVVNHAATQFEVEGAVARKIVEATKSAVCAK